MTWMLLTGTHILALFGGAYAYARFKVGKRKPDTDWSFGGRPLRYIDADPVEVARIRDVGGA